MSRVSQWCPQIYFVILGQKTQIDRDCFSASENDNIDCLCNGELYLVDITLRTCSLQILERVFCLFTNVEWNWIVGPKQFYALTPVHLLRDVLGDAREGKKERERHTHTELTTDWVGWVINLCTVLMVRDPQKEGE